MIEKYLYLIFFYTFRYETLSGIAGGMVTIVSCIYISEVLPVKYRSTLGSARSAEHHYEYWQYICLVRA